MIGKQISLPLCNFIEVFDNGRGNHETYSSNSGLGYWIFLDQHLKGEALGLKGNGEQGIFGLFTQKPQKNLSLIHG